MSALLKKEFALSAHPMTFITVFFGVMLLIPSYPYFVAFFYVTLGIFFAFMNARENGDVYFSLILPVSKRDTVRSKCLFVVIVEVASVIFSIPFAFLTQRINPNGSNLAGMEANIAFYGFVFVMLGVFNFVFLTSFYKTAYKVGTAYLKSCVAMVVCIAVSESLVYIPYTKEFFDSSDIAVQIRQIPILIVGIAVFAVLMILVERKSASLFEKVDL